MRMRRALLKCQYHRCSIVAQHSPCTDTCGLRKCNDIGSIAAPSFFTINFCSHTRRHMAATATRLLLLQMRRRDRARIGTLPTPSPFSNKCRRRSQFWIPFSWCGFMVKNSTSNARGCLAKGLWYPNLAQKQNKGRLFVPKRLNRRFCCLQCKGP